MLLRALSSRLALMTSRFQDLTRPNAQPQGFFWYTDPLAWRADAVKTVPLERKLEWIAIHHQVLMLAEQQNSGHGLWFRFQEESARTPVFGVLLPEEMVVALSPGSPATLEQELANWRKATARLPFRFWMGEQRLLEGLSKQQAELHQTVRLRRPAPTPSTAPAPSTTGFERTAEHAHEPGIELKRASSADFERVLGWATAFARELKQDIESTRHEVLDLIKSGHLVVASTSTTASRTEPTTASAIASTAEPIGMLALSSSLALSPQTSMTRISLVYIDHKHRRQGLGTRMMNAIVQEIALEAVQNCVLFADSSNELSAEFYSKLGFEVCGTWVKVSTTGK